MRTYTNAFPGKDYQGYDYYGMDLRDYFAAKVLQSLVRAEHYSEQDLQAAAILSYRYADTMMEARLK